MFKIDDIKSYTSEKINLSNEDSNVLKNKILEIIESDSINIKQENVLEEVKRIIQSIPKSITTKEKVRLVYITLGKLFSYDYRVAYDMKYAYEEAAFSDTFIGKYQTCIQISEILSLVLNSFDGIEANVINRSLENIRGSYGDGHQAVEAKVKIDDNNYETYLLDLTLDLYLIQSGCRTKHFAFESGTFGEYDIIPQIETEEMDQKLNLIKSNYTDIKIKSIKEYLKKIDLTNQKEQDKLQLKLIVIDSFLNPFNGYHEGKQFLNFLFKELLDENYKEFNIYFLKEESEIKLRTFYKIELSDDTKWIFYSNNLGLISVSENIIKDLLENGWETRSLNLEQELFDIEKKK